MSESAASVQSDWRARNQRWLRRRFPAAANLLDQYASGVAEAVQIASARSGALTASIITDSGRIHVHSTFDPVTEAQRWADAQVSTGGSFLVVIGMGLGYHLESLLDRGTLRQLVVFEPNPDLFCAAMSVRNQVKLLSFSGLNLLVTSDAWFAANWLAQHYREELLHQLHLAVWPAASRYAGEFVSGFQKHLLNALRSMRVNIATEAAFSTQWIDNFFANVGKFIEDPGICSLLPCFRGRPGIIVAAGPSLEKNGHLLSGAKGRAVIIAAGSAINPLLKQGIEPDLLVSFDPGEANYRHFENLHAPNLPLVYVPTIFPRILETYVGPRFTASMNTFPFIDWVLRQLNEEKGSLASGPSVANISWHLAFQMGLNPIILVGQDLAYTGSKSHAAGAAHAREVNINPDEIRARYLAVEGVDGSVVYTDRPMNAMKMWFEYHIAHAPTGHLTIDATEGGAKIEGTRIMPLKEALAAYCQEVFEPHPTILEVHQKERERLQSENLRARWEAALAQLEAHLRETHDLASIGLRDGKQLLGECKTKRLTEQRYREAVNRLHRLMTELSRQTPFRVFISPLIPHILDSLTLSVQRRWLEQTKLHDKGWELARQYLLLFGSVKEISMRVMQLVRKESAKQGGIIHA